MPIVNNNKPLLDLPMWEVLQPALSGNTGAGMTMCGDSVRFLYYMASAASFWRYDAWANSWQQLANPPGGTLGAGSVIMYDQKNSWVWALISNGVAAPTWQYYNPATNTWTARSVTNLPGTFGTDSALAFPNTTQHASAPSDDFIYLIGNASTALYRFQVSTNTWLTTLTVQPSACGAGCELGYMPGLGGEYDRLVRVRGAATNTIDYYDITANTWTNIAYVPATETFTTGSYTCRIKTAGDIPRMAIQKDNSGRIFQLDLSNLAAPKMSMLATQFVIPNGVALVGNRMDTITSSDGIEYLYMMLHTSPYLLRMPLFL